MDHAPGLSVLVDAVIVFTCVEALALYGYHRRTRRGVAPAVYALNMLSGLCLMLALRSALATTLVWAAPAWLLLAGLAHGADIARHWRRRGD